MKTKKPSCKKTLYKDYSKFAKKIGILDEEQLTKLGWKCDNGNRICFSQLNKLLDFVDELNKPTNAEHFIVGKNFKIKKYHIATDLDAGDLESSYCEENNIDPEDEGIRVVGTCIVNESVYVNRMDYYLCDGDSDVRLTLEEVEEI